MSAQYDFVAGRLDAVLREIIEYDYEPMSMGLTGFSPMPGDFTGYVPGANQMLIRFVERTDPAQDEQQAQENVEYRVDADYTTVTVPVKTWLPVAEYTLDEVDQAIALGVDLPAGHVGAAAESARRQHDKLAFRGGVGAVDSFALSPRVASSAAPNPLATQNNEGTLVRTLSNFVGSVALNSKLTHRANNLAISSAVMSNLRAQHFDNGLSALTVLRNTLDGVTIREIPALADVRAGGMAVAYNDSPRNLKNMLLVDAQNLGVRDYKTRFEVPVRAKSAGAYWTRPLAARYLTATG